MKVGKLQFRQNYAHGNPYFRLLRDEVKSFALELHGAKGIEEQEVKYKLQKVNKEVNSLKRKISSLEKQKIELMEIQKQAKAPLLAPLLHGAADLRRQTETKIFARILYHSTFMRHGR